MVRVTNYRFDERHGKAYWDILIDGEQVALLKSTNHEKFGKHLMVMFPGGKRVYVQDQFAAMEAVKPVQHTVR